MKKLVLILSCVFGLSAKGHTATSTIQPVSIPYITIVSSVSQAGAPAVSSATLTSTAGPFSSGLYDYITNIHIEMYATGTLTGGATPVTCTTTNLNGLVFKFPTAAATGTNTVTDIRFINPLASIPGNAVTVSCPATASVIWNVTIGYYTAS